jgi:pimeloyl-ACP methyl ester carboxylesterase
MIEKEESVEIILSDVRLNGNLFLKADSRGLVIFAHGRGSSRFSRRNRFVAEVLQENGHSTLLMDLLTESEEKVDIVSRKYRFDIPMLAKRVSAVKEWVRSLSDVSDLPVGLFGSSTGAAAALIAAAENPRGVKAFVSRGGRVDLADKFLSKVRGATLFIVGSRDKTVLELNREAFQKLECEKELKVIEGASHLFEEPGKLEKVAELASMWFSKNF